MSSGSGTGTAVGYDAVFGAMDVRDGTGRTGESGEITDLRRGNDERQTIPTTFGTRPHRASSDETS